LSHDAGLDLYRSDTHSATPEERSMRALQGAHQRYLATAEHARVYPVDAAIRKLGEYVLISVVHGARSLDSELLYGLPDILEPYTLQSPLLEAIWLNMRGSREGHCNCNYERARELWSETIQKVDALVGVQDPIVGRMRSAVLYALGSAETQLGLISAADRAQQLDSVATQRISALQLRKIVRLEQGDVEGAERLRKQAEILSLQQRLPQMFNASLWFDAFVYAMCNNLAGLKQTIEQIKPLAARYSDWVPVLLHAEGCFQLVRGDYEAAQGKFEDVVARGRNQESGARVYFWTWMNCHAGLSNCLLRLGRVEEAREVACAALRECEARGTGVSAFYLIRMLALVESKLSDPQGAQRLDALIARQNAIGASGLRLGLSYEARARIAISSGDAAGFEHFSELTAREYRHGARTPLAARYERLMNEAARAGMHAKLTLAEFQRLSENVGSSLHSDELLTLVTRSMAGHRKTPERAQVALQMICSALAARSGHLYLLTSAGPVLNASHGKSAPPSELAERVSDYALALEQQAKDLDDMETGALGDDNAPGTVFEIESRSYELLSLSCAVESSSVLVGVAAIEQGGARNASEHTALLNALAASLLESGAGHTSRPSPSCSS
jgi:tetratricopeptide (TPR) repeat protein